MSYFIIPQSDGERGFHKEKKHRGRTGAKGGEQQQKMEGGSNKEENVAQQPRAHRHQFIFPPARRWPDIRKASTFSYSTH